MLLNYLQEGQMLFSILKFFILGLLWLLIFSIPVDKHQRVFHVCYNSVIDTKPVDWTLEKIQNAFRYAGVKASNFGSQAFEEKE